MTFLLLLLPAVATTAATMLAVDTVAVLLRETRSTHFNQCAILYEIIHAIYVGVSTPYLKWCSHVQTRGY